MTYSHISAATPPGMAAFLCPGSCRISRLLCSSCFRFRYPRHFIGGGGRGVFLEVAGRGGLLALRPAFSYGGILRISKPVPTGI